MAAKPRKRYAVYDKETDELVVEGTVHDCAAATGLTTAAVYHAASGCLPNDRYEVEELEEERATNSIEAAARAWDKFCEPIRKEFGIRVRRSE